jgi:shikimate kinase
MILKLKRTPGIYLVGFMACGKTTVGRALADELGWNFSDLDEEVESRAQSTVPQIFDSLGEAVFREMETVALRERVRNVQSGQPHVIALGGGAFLTQENFELATNHGITVWLDCSFSIIEQRVAAATHRPLAMDPVEFRRLFDARREGYARAHYHIQLQGDDPQAAVAQILALPLFVP